jgi:DNA polymerase-3 subunit gamma/tau
MINRLELEINQNRNGSFMAQAYYRKWRPLDWDAVIGQDHIIRTLKNAMAKNRIAHAYLFSGPRGTGKTSTARIIAKAVNCLTEDEGTRPCNSCDHCEAINKGRFLDLIEIDAASNTSVDDIRSLREKINFAPTQGRYKVYIIDEVHMLSNAAFNALLKTLEEPPPHAIFVLATTEVHKIPATVLSRCQRHEFRRIPINFIQTSLKKIAEVEGIGIDTAALTAIARQATGSMRDAVSLLDQLASTGIEVTLALTKDVLGTAGSESVVSLIESILDKDAGKGIATIIQALDNGSDPRQFGRQVVDYLRSILMVKMGNIKQLEIETEEQEKLQNFANRFEVSKLLDALQKFDRSSQSNNAGWQPGLQLELAVTQLTYGDKPSVKENFSPKQEEEIPQLVKSKKPQRVTRTNEKTGPDPDKKITPENEVVNIESAPKANRPESEKIGDGDAIQSQWKEIRAEAKMISPETAALLNSCKSVNIHRGRLELGFLSPILQSKMENGQNIGHAKQAIKQVCGIDIEIHCVVAGKDRSPLPPDIEVDHDGMLGTALSLGGKMTKEDK